MFTTPTNASGIASKFRPSPSSPPVSPFGFFCTSTVPACANASVTIANAIPLTRRLIAPSTSGTTIPTPDHHEQRRRQTPLPLRQRNRGHVDADREVEGVAEREEAGEAEEEVVRERDAGEDEAQREQPERAGTVQRPAEQDREVERERRHEREPHQQQRGHQEGAQPRQCATFGESPSGFSRSTIASRSTTARSPRPLEA